MAKSLASHKFKWKVQFGATQDWSFSKSIFNVWKSNDLSSEKMNGVFILKEMGGMRNVIATYIVEKSAWRIAKPKGIAAVGKRSVGASSWTTGGWKRLAVWVLCEQEGAIGLVPRGVFTDPDVEAVLFCMLSHDASISLDVVVKMFLGAMSLSGASELVILGLRQARTISLVQQHR
ncbi:hypothetical protein Tco_1498978 [Tanacetum coccineum]